MALLCAISLRKEKHITWLFSLGAPRLKKEICKPFIMGIYRVMTLGFKSIALKS